jgi:hypothetical protein
MPRDGVCGIVVLRLRRRGLKRSSARKQPRASRKPQSADTPDPAFDQWLDNRLKKLYASVLNEAVPDDMLKLLAERPRRR